MKKDSQAVEGGQNQKDDWKREGKNEWLNPIQVAKYLGISLSQVYWYMRQYPPPWPFYRVTATKRNTKRADLDAWLEKRKVSASVLEQV